MSTASYDPHAVTRYLGILEGLLADIAAGALGPGAPVPSVRQLARREGVAPATAARVHAELARLGVIAGGPRRRAAVTSDGRWRARRVLGGGRALRLAGSDDPLLDLVLADRVDVDRVPAHGSFAGLKALWADTADAATLHLRHRDGTYNAPFARSVLAGRDPQLVPLWRREQGLLVAAGNPRGIDGVTALDGLTLGLRAPGTGTRALLERLVATAGCDPSTLRGAVHGSHFEVAMAVACGSADTGLATRAAAVALGLDFVPLAWEPYELALPRAALELAEPLLAAVRDGAATLAERWGGYEILV
jgi:putative molybdopterin biosynthesis protein